MKNKKGLVALILALLALISLVLTCIPFVPLQKYPKIPFYSSINTYFALAAIVLGIAALIVGIIGRKGAQKKGTATAGLIIGIFMIIFGILGSLFALGLNLITDYLNDKPGNFISENYSEKEKQELDKTFDNIFNKYK